MSTPTECIREFLNENKACQAERLEVAIVFAESMLRELRSSVADWESALQSLEEAQQRSKTAGLN